MLHKRPVDYETRMELEAPTPYEVGERVCVVRHFLHDGIWERLGVATVGEVMPQPGLSQPDQHEARINILPDAPYPPAGPFASRQPIWFPRMPRVSEDPNLISVCYTVEPMEIIEN